jgi:septum formation protein
MSPGDGLQPLAAITPATGLVLASTSVYRRALLERVGIPFRCRAPQCDEQRLKGADTDPRSLAERLAHAKAASLVADEPGITIIGCDQVVSFQGQIFGKPVNLERAVDQLALLAGQSHELITALVVICGEQVFRHTDVSTLWMRPLSRPELARYVASDQPLDCAGSYKLEARGIVLFERIDSLDHSAITGLPLIALVSILRELGFEIP